MSCVTFAELNGVEAQERLLTGRQPNYSDRYTAVMSGTERDGNWLYKVADSIRHNGLVEEAAYPSPTEPWTWDEYHRPITDPLFTELLQMAYTWKESHSYAYEFIPLTPDAFRYHLKHAPIVVVFPNHATLVVGCEADIVHFFDSYAPYLKQKAFREFTSAMKGVLTINNINEMPENQTKVVLSKDGKTVYKCVPVATDFESFRKQASVEGVAIPDPIPPSSDL